MHPLAMGLLTSRTSEMFQIYTRNDRDSVFCNDCLDILNIIFENL